MEPSVSNGATLQLRLTLMWTLYTLENVYPTRCTVKVRVFTPLARRGTMPLASEGWSNATKRRPLSTFGTAARQMGCASPYANPPGPGVGGFNPRDEAFHRGGFIGTRLQGGFVGKRRLPLGPGPGGYANTLFVSTSMNARLKWKSSENGRRNGQRHSTSPRRQVLPLAAGTMKRRGKLQLVMNTCPPRHLDHRLSREDERRLIDARRAIESRAEDLRAVVDLDSFEQRTLHLRRDFDASLRRQRRQGVADGDYDTDSDSERAEPRETEPRLVQRPSSAAACPSHRSHAKRMVRLASWQRA